MATTRSDRVSLVLEFCGRAAFAALAFAYFYGMPDASSALDVSMTVAGLVFYLVAHGFLLTQRLLARPAFWQAPATIVLDFIAVLGVVIADPFPAPPTLLLVLVVALNAGMHRGWMAGSAAIAGGVAVVVAALNLRGLTPDASAAHGMLFLLTFMLACLVYFAVLAVRRSNLEAEAAQFPDTDLETRLLNRRGFDSAARYLVPLHHRTQLPLVVMLASLDTREASPLDARVLEKAVRAFGQAVRLRARRSDVVARLNDSEFVFMLFDTPLAGSETLAKGMLEQFNTWANTQSVDARLTLGMVNMPLEPVAVDQLIARARSAVQRAQKHPSSPGVVTASAL